MMQRIAFLAIPVFLVAGAVLLWQSQGDDKAVVAQEPPTSELATVLGVDQLMREVDAYQGSLQVEGAVSAVAAEDQSLALIDVREYKQCGVVTCAALTLPVHWAGAMPAVRDVVRLEGEVKESSGKLVFFASSLQKVAFDPEAPQ